MFSIAEAGARIERGERLFLAGDEKALRRLPRGDWVGGTIPYFMTEAGGQHCVDRVSAMAPPSFATSVTIATYDAHTIAGVYNDAPDDGFSLIVIPAASPAHRSFALGAPGHGNFASRPLVGWIAGVSLEDLGSATPKIFDGRTGVASEDGAIVMHVALPRGKMADVGIINIFEVILAYAQALGRRAEAQDPVAARSSRSSGRPVAARGSSRGCCTSRAPRARARQRRWR